MNSHLLLAGAGLATSLIAIAVAERRPGTRITLIDRGDGPSDSHTWSFHDPDIVAHWHHRLSPAIRCRWTGQEVRFSDHARQLRAGYASVNGDALRQVLTALPGVTLHTHLDISEIGPDGVTAAGLGHITADCVIDGRGFAPSPYLVTGYQKFLGIELETDQPHGVTQPIIMDATVPQRDGYRFVYVLPFSPTRLLIEDTRYSDGGRLDDYELATSIKSYAADHGWHGREVRRERGVLPIALAHDARAFWAAGADGPVPVGMRAGFFHPVTGYSLPVAAQIADLVADVSPLTTAAVRAAVRDHALARARDDRFLRFLNRMLFRGCAPDRRHHILSRFYRLREPLIERFYAGRLTHLDRLSILTGKPPIPIRNALPCLSEAALLRKNT